MKRRTRNPDASRERILEAAAELFSQRGYAGVGVDELAARSGIAKTAIYHHFGNKDGLLAAVVERTAAAWIEGIRQASSEGSSPLENLDRALAGMRMLLEEKPWVFKLLQILALEVADQKPEIRATLQSLLRRATAAIVEGMREAMGAPVPEAEVIARAILALLHGIAMGEHVDPDNISLDQSFAGVRRVWVLLTASYVLPDLMPTIEQSVGTPGAPRAPRPA
jgi:AcrR family transcriptional regulator